MWIKGLALGLGSNRIIYVILDSSCIESNILVFVSELHYISCCFVRLFFLVIIIKKMKIKKVCNQKNKIL